MDSIDRMRAEAEAFAERDAEVTEEEVQLMEEEMKKHALEHSGGVLTLVDEKQIEALEAGDTDRAAVSGEPVSAGLPEGQEGVLEHQSRAEDGSASAHSTPTLVPQRPQTSSTFINGSKLYLGELLPWKGVIFQVIGLNGEHVALRGLDVTGSERKRLEKEFVKR